MEVLLQVWEVDLVNIGAAIVLHIDTALSLSISAVSLL